MGNSTFSSQFSFVRVIVLTVTFSSWIVVMGVPCAFAEAPDAAATELIENQQKQQEIYKSINTLNPLSNDYGTAAIPLSKLDPPGQNNLVYLEKILSNPVVQGSLKVAGNVQFQTAMLNLMNHPNRNLVLYLEIGWLIFFFLFKTWRATKAQSGIIRLIWLKLWTTALYISVSSGLIPYFAFGNTYTKVVNVAIQSYSSKPARTTAASTHMTFTK